jgi:hypothetical protein
VLLEKVVQQLQQGQLLAAHSSLADGPVQRPASGARQLPQASALLSSLLGGSGGLTPLGTSQGARHTPGLEGAASSTGVGEQAAPPQQAQQVQQQPAATAAQAAATVHTVTGGSARQPSADQPSGQEQSAKRARLNE